MISNLCLLCLCTAFAASAYSFPLKCQVNSNKLATHVNPVFRSISDEIPSQTRDHFNAINANADCNQQSNGFHRRSVLANSAATLLSTITAPSLLESAIFVKPANAKCTDIESCREVGERKVEEDLRLNPIVKLPSGTRYRILRPPTGSSSSSGGRVVNEGSSVDLAFSISSGSGQYMYRQGKLCFSFAIDVLSNIFRDFRDPLAARLFLLSFAHKSTSRCMLLWRISFKIFHSKGFGFEKIDFGGRQESDLGLDSIRAVIGHHDVPIGIEEALIGMGRGERRRVELPAGTNVGFESSNWQPAPTSRRGIVQIQQYKKKLSGFGSQPPFPAETVWDIEVLAIR